MNQTFLAAVQTELERAQRLHPTPIHSPAEGYAVILEEVDEFWDWVRTKPSQRVPSEMLKELVEVAAMAMRTAIDCGLIDPTEAE